MKQRTSSGSDNSQPALMTTESSGATSPALAPVSSKESTIPFLSGRSIKRSTTIDTFFRSRSRSPRPAPPTTLSPNKTPTILEDPVSSSPPSSSPPLPAPFHRHKSEGSIPTTISPLSGPQSPGRHDSFFQKKPRHQGHMSHYGRHGNDWLFGGVSLTQTVKGVVAGGGKRRQSSGTEKDRQ